MREIKFRVWDKVVNKWLDYEDVYFDQEGEVYLIEERDWAYQSYMYKENITEKVKVVRFTGLKDVHGKEIYEGDILKFNTDAPGVVDYFRGSWRVKTPPRYRGDDWRTSLWDATLDGYEIIGNIYENPELLNGVGGVE